MQPEPAMKLTELLVNTCLPLQRAVRKIPGVRSIVHRLAPVMSYYSALPQLNDQLQREWALLDTHDSLTDEFKHSRSKEEITKALQYLEPPTFGASMAATASKRVQANPSRSNIPAG
jgi:hypothetical protein